MGAFILICLYLLPSIIAGIREHHNGSAIFVVNLCLGWTVIGWLISFFWAFTSQPKQNQIILIQKEDGTFERKVS